MVYGDWEGMTTREGWHESDLALRDRLADAARDGSWPVVLEVLDGHPSLIDAWRPGGPSLYTAMHQAAWHGVPPDTVRRLLRCRPRLTLRTAAGDRPFDIALRGGHEELATLLRPTIHHPLSTDTLYALERHLHAVITKRIAEFGITRPLRLPPVDLFTEMATPTMWFAIPGMYGGFKIELTGQELVTESFSRVVEGSGEKHRIRSDGPLLVAEGSV